MKVRERRKGFTLIEVLMVITVMLILLSVSALVIGNIITSAREKATAGTIAKVNGLLQSRLEAFQREMEKDKFADAQKQLTKTFLIRALSSSIPGPVERFTIDNANDKLMESLSRSRWMREAFPVAFVEICGPDRVPGTSGSFNPANGAPSNVTQFGTGTSHGDVMAFATQIQRLMTAPAVHRPETESSELLYLALTSTQVLGVAPVGADEFSTNEIADTDGDGLKEFVDAWGRPLRFYRWPTRLIRCGEDTFTGDTNSDGSTTFPPDANSQADPQYASVLIASLPSAKAGDLSLKRDPADQYGLIISGIIKANDNTGGQPSPTLQTTRRTNFERWFYTPETYTTPLIISAGADGVLGINEPATATTPIEAGLLGQLLSLGEPAANPITDNITNRQR